MKEKFKYFNIFFVISTCIFSQTNNYLEQYSNIISTEASYKGDFVNNFSGGNKKGIAYLGMANIKLGFTSENVGLWNGGEVFINGSATHGSTPSAELFGDIHVVSNIEAGNHTYLQELWYRHSLNSLEFIIGLQDLNAEFVTTEYSGSFINSSFGIPSLISNNIPVPLFPLTALGVSVKYSFNESIIFQTALFDGLQDDFAANKYNLKWNLHKDDGVLTISEIQFKSEINNLQGTYKAGFYYHSHLKTYTEELVNDEKVFNNNYGFYLLANQTISENGENSLGVFAQIAVSPSNINLHNYYVGGGISYKGKFADECGLAIAHAGFNNTNIKHETTIEAFYKIQLTEILFIQPDIQYIINPAGSDSKLDNALAGLIRFDINF